MFLFKGKEKRFSEGQPEVHESFLSWLVAKRDEENR